MTTGNVMSKCPDCNAILLRANACEACGWPKVRAKHASASAFASVPSPALARAFAEKLDKVEAYVAKYQAKHPGATKRDACMALMRKKGWLTMLPEALRK